MNNSENQKLQRDPVFCGFYVQEPKHFVTVNMGEKLLPVLGRARGKGRILKYARAH